MGVPKTKASDETELCPAQELFYSCALTPPFFRLQWTADEETALLEGVRKCASARISPLLSCSRLRWAQRAHFCLPLVVMAARYGTGKWRQIQKDEQLGPVLQQRSNVDLKARPLAAGPNSQVIMTLRRTTAEATLSPSRRMRLTRHRTAGCLRAVSRQKSLTNRTLFCRTSGATCTHRLTGSPPRRSCRLR